MQRPNFNLYPQPTSGYHFTDSQGRVHDGNSWPDLVQKVRIYRTVNGQEVGEVEAEVYAQFCSAYPDYCGETSRGAPAEGPGNPVAGFASQVMNWLAQVYTAHNRGRMTSAAADESLRRAEVCANCPRQQNWKVGCVSCNHNFELLSFDMLKGRPQSAAIKRLMGCNALNEDTQVSVQLNQPARQDAGQPDFCWRRV